MAITVKSALQRAREQLKEQGGGTPELDAEVLLCHSTGLDRAGLYREWDRLLAESEESRYFALIRRRLAGEPVAYITGRREFMGLDFMVNPSVLIPRPETELLVESALELMPPSPTVIDVGTGSGAIAVSLAVFRPDAVVYATDRSPEALDVARLNAARHGVGDRVSFYLGDLLEPLAAHLPAGRVDLVAANLPYIAREDLPGLPREVRLFEPNLALDGGAGGLELYRRLIPAAAAFLKRGGRLLLEIGCEQGREIKALLDLPGWQASVLRDLAGLDRLAVARYEAE